ncbi:MAG: metallophosphatase family protein [Oscillospiraceae bacterium]|nr:metallophosphatase family protein [Oscillospiraceae bacterium]
MRYAVISDIHGNLPALEAVIHDARKNHVNQFILLGDYCVGLGYPNEVVGRIRSMESCFTVSGNEEEALTPLSSIGREKWPVGQFGVISWMYQTLFDSNRSYLFSLPQEIIIKKDNFPPVFIFHKPQRYFLDTSPCFLNPQYFVRGMDEKKFDCLSYGTHSENILCNDIELHKLISFMESGVYVFGHTHIPLCWEYEGKLLLNPGSCGLPLDFNCNASYGILEITENSYKATLRRVAYDVNETLNYTRKSDYSKKNKVWSGIITKELETARAQADPFLEFAERYATDIQDNTRPFKKETWCSAYEAWCDKKND